MRSTLAITVLLVALVASACGSDDGSGADSETTTTTAAPTTTTAVPETTTTVAETTTMVAETTTTTSVAIPTAPIVPGEDEDVDAIVEAYLVVFDSTTTFEEKTPFVTDLAGLEDTIVAYEAAGEAVGGIQLRADEVGIDGDQARVIYAFLFAGNPAYSDLEGEAVLTDAGWQVTREFFCDIMASARVGCP